jgi:hypothetical protein
VNNVLGGDLAAQGRFATLASAVGGEPQGGFHRATLARLASWSDSADVNALSFMINRRVGEAVQRYRDALAELVPLIRRSRETNDDGDVIVVIPEALARQLISITEDEAGS